jgi:2-(1,2-epoxy-1,2-dihydrophenyl)acetyl-CoA isomerase
MSTDVTVREGIAYVLLNAPERLNAMTLQDWHEMRDTFGSLQRDKQLRGVVVYGSGRAFCAGADLGTLQDLETSSVAQRREMLLTGLEVIMAVIRIEVPTVAVVDGVAYGGGASLALACDRVIVTDRAKLGFVFTRLGLPGSDMLAHWLLVRRVSTRKALRLLQDAAVVSAADAVAMGLADEIACETDIDIVSSLQWPLVAPGAARITKRQILEIEGAYTELDAIAADHVTMTAHLVGGAEVAEGFRAIRERRDPQY